MPDLRHARARQRPGLPAVRRPHSVLHCDRCGPCARTCPPAQKRRRLIQARAAGSWKRGTIKGTYLWMGLDCAECPSCGLSARASALQRCCLQRQKARKRRQRGCEDAQEKEPKHGRAGGRQAHARGGLGRVPQLRPAGARRRPGSAAGCGAGVPGMPRCGAPSRVGGGGGARRAAPQGSQGIAPNRSTF